MKEHWTQGEIAKAAQVTEVTIRNRYKELARRLSFTVTI
jgi:transcription initiation factor TFIIIB Brf1 subunit/transcription initiation factor TFIIB